MELISQKSSIEDLARLAKEYKHSILIEGVEGSGKSYLAKQYAMMLDILDFQMIEPKVQNIKDAINACYMVENSIVICIENLDAGVLAASYALLKFLEEPADHVYVIVTCRNIQNVPDTIISRSAVVTVPPPIESDLITYANEKNSAQYLYLQNQPIWKCAKTFKDVEIILELDSGKLDYFNTLISNIQKHNSVSNLVWMLQKYPDNSLTPIQLVIRYIMYTTNSKTIWNAGHSCLHELSLGRIATHAVLAKFAFELKYLK